MVMQMAESKKCILVIDDSGMMLRLIKSWFEDKYQVILANSGAMALKYLSGNIPDIILLDYEMPVMNGLEVLEKIRTETKAADVPVLFLTSKDDISDVLKDLTFKTDGYVLKSMKPEEIVQIVEDMLT